MSKQVVLILHLQCSVVWNASIVQPLTEWWEDNEHRMGDEIMEHVLPRHQPTVSEVLVKPDFTTDAGLIRRDAALKEV